MMRLALAQKVARGEVHSDVARAFEASGGFFSQCRAQPLPFHTILRQPPCLPQATLDPRQQHLLLPLLGPVLPLLRGLVAC